MRRLATLASLIVFLAGLACLWAWQTATDPVVLAEPVFVEIPKGAGSRAIAKELAQRGIVRDANLLLVLARLHGKDRTIRYGGHRFEGSMTMEDVLTELARVPKPTLKLTVPEGLTWAEIGAALEAEKLTTAEDWKEAVCSAPFLERSGAPPDGNCAEGFLFPDTYHLEPGMSAEAIAALLLARFEEVWSELHAAHEIPAALADGEKLLQLRSLVSQALEKARADKVITNNLEAVVTLTLADRDALETWTPRLGELEEFFILSGLKLEAGPADAAAVIKAGTAKCGRCWRHRDSVGEVASHPDLCDRCAEAVESAVAAAQ